MFLAWLGEVTRVTSFVGFGEPTLGLAGLSGAILSTTAKVHQLACWKYLPFGSSSVGLGFVDFELVYNFTSLEAAVDAMAATIDPVWLTLISPTSTSTSTVHTGCVELVMVLFSSTFSTVTS
jgi:hypothetical protein